MSNDQDGINRRASPRLRSLKSGRIYINEKSSIDCVIRDLSATGAKLEFEVWFECPKEIMLRYRDSDQAEVKLKCTVAWQSDRRLGVRFINPPD